MRNKRLYFVILIILGLLSSPSTLLSQAGAVGQIAFVSDRDGNREIYLINADGTGLTNLTNHPAEDYSPAWSPDGRQLAFVSDRSGTAQIYVMDADGNDIRQLTNLEQNARRPVWSPDGSKIAFATELPFRENNIYWIASDGTELTQVFSGEGYGGRISWSADGRQLIFDHHSAEGFDLFLVNLDGSGLHTFASDVTAGGPTHGKPSWEFAPAWSPDGRLIAFNSNRLEGRLDVYIANLDGSDLRNLTPHVNYAFGPVWSPDSRRLAFMSAGEGIYVAEVGSTQLTKLSELSHLGTDADWSWSPDGRYLAFATGSGRNFNIYVVAHDGSEQTALISHPAHNADPVWRPVPPPIPPEVHIAYLGQDGNVWLITSDGSERRQVTNDGVRNWSVDGVAKYCCPLWSPDGQMLAFEKHILDSGYQEHLLVYSLLEDQIRALVADSSLLGFDWTPDSSAIVYASSVPEAYWGREDGESIAVNGLWQVNVTTGERTELVPPRGGYPLAAPKWSPDGRYLGFVEVEFYEGPQPFAVYDFADNSYIAWREAIGLLDWAPDGDFIVYDATYYGESIGITRADPLGESRMRLTIANPPALDMAPLVSPTGDHVAFTRYGADASLPQLWVMASDGSGAAVLGSYPISLDFGSGPVVYSGYSWAPDGEWLAVVNGLSLAVLHATPEIYLVHRQSGRSVMLVGGAWPVWQPAVVGMAPETGIDLAIESVIPVQVIEGAPLVRGKATAIKVVVRKTGSEPVNNVSVRVSAGSFVSTQFYVAEPANMDEFHTLIAPNAQYPLNFGPGESSKTVYFFGNGFMPYGNSYQVEAVVDHLKEIEESNEENNRLQSEPVAVQDVRWGIISSNLHIHYFPYGWDDEALPGFAAFYHDSTAFIKSLFPVSENRFTPARSDSILPVDPCPRIGRFSADELQLCALILMGIMTLAHPTADRYVAVVPPNWFRNETDIPNTLGGSWWESIARLTVLFAEIVPETTPNGLRPMIAAHEVGHTYNLPATVPDGCREDYDDCNPLRIGFPGCEYPPGSPYLLGSQAARGVWVDRRMLIQPGDGRYVFSIMGTGVPANAPEDCQRPLEYWSTEADYLRLLNPRHVEEPEAAMAISAGPMLMVSGIISVTGEAALHSWYVLPEGEIDVPVEGTYQFVLEGDNGEVIYQHGFGTASPEEIGEIPEAIPFFFRLPYPPQTQRIVLRRGEEELAIRQVSANAPVVTGLAARHLTESDEVIIKWEGSDADGDALAYSLLYSADEGETWLALTYNQTDTHYTWNVVGFPSERPYRFRLIATDGINTTTEETVAETGMAPPTLPVLSTDSEQEQGLAPGAEDEVGDPSAEFQGHNWFPIALGAAGVVVGLTLLVGGGLLLWRRRRLARQPYKVDGRFCVHCGAQYPPTGKFCIRCGQERV
jgi:TolB protein